MNTEQKIQKARSMLILDHPFFGCLALKLKHQPDENCETAATDGITLFYNPNYIDSLSSQELVGLIAHEVMHCALGHQWRQENRDNRKWNVACDYTINENLIKTGFTLPQGGLFDSRYSNLSAEEIYSMLPKEDEQQGRKSASDENKKNDPGMCGAVLPSKNDIEEQKAEWKASVSQAVQIAKGSLPENIKRQVEEIINPPLPWYVLLRDFVERTAKNDYSWSKPSPRYFSQGFVLPSLISEELPEIAVVIDTSGSISNETLGVFTNELCSIFQAYNTKIRVLHCDSKIGKEEEFTRDDFPIKLEPVGGGGTRFTPAFNYIEEKNIEPCCLLYFTDLYGSFPTKEPYYPVMWISTTKNKKAPFGETIYF